MSLLDPLVPHIDERGYLYLPKTQCDAGCGAFTDGENHTPTCERRKAWGKAFQTGGSWSPKSPKEILYCVYQLLGVREDQITGPSREVPIVNARRVAAIAMSRKLKLAHSEIGVSLNRDRSTVSYLIRSSTKETAVSLEMFERAWGSRPFGGGSDDDGTHKRGVEEKGGDCG